jgi:hypothetical protein
MARRQPTAEQKQKAAERRERFRALAQTVSKMTDDERAALVMRAGAVLTCEGRALSGVNTVLLLMQRPGVSVVGGFWQWKRVGRRVVKGASGLSLWIPRMGKAEGSPAEGPADVAYCGEPIDSTEGQKKNPGRRFLVGTVFDVSQTEPDSGVDVGTECETGELVAV